MAIHDITPQNSPKKPIKGAFYGTSGFGVYTAEHLIIVINETQAGECNLNTSNPCTATSTHQAIPSLETGVVNYTWSVHTTGTSNPQIISGQGTDTVEVSDSKGDLGAETLVDPEFSDPANFTVTTNAVVASDQLAMTVTAGGMEYAHDSVQSPQIFAGIEYEVTYDVESASGEFVICSGAGNNVSGAPTFNSAGVTTATFVSDTNYNKLGVKRATTTGDYACVVNSYSVKEVGAVDPDSSFILVCEATDDVSTTRTGVRVSHKRELFDGGMFVNGGFEDGLSDWLQYSDWTATVDASTVENPATGTNQVLYQNFTLDVAEYEISCDYVEGNATINYFVNDADSGVSVTDGTYTFTGNGGAVSIGIFISDIGTVKSVIDSMRLKRK